MKQQLFYAVLLVLLTNGCQIHGEQTEEKLPQIDLNKEYPVKEIWLQDVAEVTYIPLETTDKMLFKGSVLDLSDEGIAGMNRKEGQFFLFDGNGKAKGVIDRKGGGPEEYADVVQAAVDWKQGEFYVLDPKSRVCVYALDGTFKRILETKNIIRDRDLCLYGDHSLMLFKEIPEGGNAEKLAPYRPLVVLSKADGKLDSLSYVKSHNAFITATLGEMKGYNFVPALRSYGGETYLNDVASDTIFRINPTNARLEPFFTRIPSVRDEQGGKNLLIVKGIAAPYLFLKRQVAQVDLEKQTEKKENRYLVYNLQTGETFQPVFKNKDFSSQELRNRNFEHCSGSKGNHFQLDAFQLKEALEKGELTGELKKIATRIAEDDNPVLMTVDFKKMSSETKPR